MKVLTGIIGAGVIGVGAIVWAQDSAQAPTGLFEYSNADTVTRGAAIYQETCASCHGDALQGQADWRSPGQNGRMPAPPHDQTGHTWHHPDTQLFQIVKYGTSALVGNGYESDMAGYEGVLSDGEVLDVMAFIKSTWPADIIERHDEVNAARAAQ